MTDSPPWSTEPNVSGRYLCLRNGVFTLYDIEYYRDPQMGISEWEATEVRTGNRASWSVASLQPAHWLLVTALPPPTDKEPTRLRNCPTHGQQPPWAWGCPECVRQLREELAALQQRHPEPTPPAAGEPSDENCWQWQPIETAPQDGTEILASDYDAVEILSWEPPRRPGSRGCWISRNLDPMFPAWWQPLPDHPPLTEPTDD